MAMTCAWPGALLLAIRGALASDSSRALFDDPVCLVQARTVLRNNALASRDETPASASDNDTPPALEFIHIPKTAGETIAAAGMAAGYAWAIHHRSKDPRKSLREGTIQELVPVEGTNGTCPWQHVPPYLLPNFDNPYRDADTFCVTRDPYDRIVSQYRWLLAHPETWEEQEVQMFLLEPPAAYCTAAGLNFFVEVSLQAYGHQMTVQSCHLIPQADFIWGPDGHQWCKNILRLDELPEAFDELMHRKGINATLGEDLGVVPNCPDLSAADLTDAARALVEATYRDDFALGYPVFSAAAPTG